LCFSLAGAAGTATDPGTKQLAAPTYYIAARVRYDGDPNKLRVIGASNLPSGARLLVNVYRYIGEGGKPLSESAGAVLDSHGFFETSVHPTKGNKFEHNLACDVLFMPYSNPPQPQSVLQIVGSHGEHLGFPKNPQVEVTSGNYNLDELVHVP
jgi:hypothetical protein